MDGYIYMDSYGYIWLTEKKKKKKRWLMVIDGD